MGFDRIAGVHERSKHMGKIIAYVINAACLTVSNNGAVITRGDDGITGIEDMAGNAKRFGRAKRLDRDAQFQPGHQ